MPEPPATDCINVMASMDVIRNGSQKERNGTAIPCAVRRVAESLKRSRSSFRLELIVLPSRRAPVGKGAALTHPHRPDLRPAALQLDRVESIGICASS